MSEVTDCAVKALKLAAEKGNLERVQELLGLGLETEIDPHTIHYCACLAVMHGHIDIVRFLVGKGVDVNRNGTMLQWAASYGKNQNLDILKFLVEECGADVNARWDRPIYYAAEHGHLDRVKYLIEHGADVDGSLNILGAAVRGGDPDIVKLLLAHNIDIVNTHGGVALNVAVERGNLELAKILIEHGADIHFANDTVMCTAVSANKYPMVKFLLEQGLDIHAGNDAALREAIREEHFELAMILVNNHGANIHAEGGEQTPLRLAARTGDYEFVKFLLDRSDETGSSFSSTSLDHALVEAAERGDLHIVKLLRKYGACVHAFGNAPLHKAAEAGHLSTIRYLLENGAA